MSTPKSLNLGTMHFFHYLTKNRAFKSLNETYPVLLASLIITSTAWVASLSSQTRVITILFMHNLLVISFS
jgi:hypothetical protein